MKHGIEQIIQFFRGLHDDTILFCKSSLVVGTGSAIFLFGNTFGDIHFGYEVVIKACTVGSVAILSGMGTVGGKHLMTFLIKKFTKKKAKDKPEPFSKNGQNKKAS